MNYLILTYVIYAVAAVGLTSLLAKTLFKSGSVFLEKVFDDMGIAEAVNRLLVVGFYMLNMGYALLIFKTNQADTAIQATENLVTKLGLLLVSLGLIHFVNMAVFWRIKRSGEQVRYVPPATAGRFATNPPPPAPAARGTM